MLGTALEIRQTLSAHKARQMFPNELGKTFAVKRCYVVLNDVMWH